MTEEQKPKQKTKFERYCEELKSDVELNDVTLHQKALTCPAIKTKWVVILHQEKAYLKRLKAADKQILETAVRSNQNKPRFQHETELCAPGGKLAIIRGEIEMQEQLVLFLQDAISVIIDKFGFEIGNCVKIVDAESR